MTAQSKFEANSNTNDAQPSLFKYTLLKWLDTSVSDTDDSRINGYTIDWLRVLPFITIHAGCLGVIWVGWSTTAVAIALLLYFTRMLAITGFYHRYFSHKSFKTTRITQFLFAMIGASAAQRGPLWWASHHRHHHIHSDRHSDAHSPKHHGFLWSHLGWFTAKANFATKTARIPDLVKYKELQWLDRYDAIVPLLLLASLYILGSALEQFAPVLNTNGPQLVVWGFFISTVALYHATYTVNSLAHRFGSRRYNTKDDSRNNLFIALLTFGEGWHNNHHHYPGSVRQGFYWWEIDLTYYFLRLLASTGLIWDLRPVPASIKKSRLIK